MIKRLLTSVLLLTFLSLWSCNNDSTPEEYNHKASDPALLHQLTEQLTDVIVYDIFKPPVASRVYAYTYLAAYEVLRNQFPEYPTLAGKVNEFQQVPSPEEGKAYCFPLASMKAFTTMGRELTFSTTMWDEFEKEFYEKYEAMGIPKDVYQRSIAYGEKVAEHVLAYAETDYYKQTKNLRYSITKEPGSWQLTPPTYADACEPQWNTIRSFTLDTCSQFTPPVPVTYDMSENSKFHELLMEVYHIGKNMTEEQKEIAYFWDDNATVTNIKGHLSFLEKKMTPPGHWIAITSTVAGDKEVDMMQSLQAYTLSSIALFDGFIASWDEKYRSVRIRPVTVIHEFIDADWMPFGCMKLF